MRGYDGLQPKEDLMNRYLRPRVLFGGGGIAASLILIGFGVAMIVIGIDGRQDVRDTLAEENIVAPADSSIPGELVDTGDEAKTMAAIMREHTLERTGGATYSELPPYLDENNQPTSNVEEAAVGPDGEPLANPRRTLWVTETALTTALNTAYFAEQVGLFAIVVGFALLLSGIGFAVLTGGALLLPALRHGEGSAGV